MILYLPTGITAISQSGADAIFISVSSCGVVFLLSNRAIANSSFYGQSKYASKQDSPAGAIALVCITGNAVFIKENENKQLRRGSEKRFLLLFDGIAAGGASV